MAKYTINQQANSQRTPMKTSLRKSTSTPYVDVESDQSSSNLKSLRIGLLVYSVFRHMSTSPTFTQTTAASDELSFEVDSEHPWNKWKL
jgi:hypothetical protein